MGTVGLIRKKEGVRKNLQDLGFGRRFLGVFKEAGVCSGLGAEARRGETVLGSGSSISVF